MTRRRFAAAGLALVVLAAAGGAVFVRAGIYDVGAANQHSRWLFELMQQGKLWSVRRRAAEIEAPEPSQETSNTTGFRLYRLHCAGCHGAPGAARADFGKGMMPAPRNLVQTGRDWTPPEIFWVVKNGIMMTGMPAWEFQLEESEIWAVTGFVKRLPYLSPRDYRNMVERAPDGNIAADPVAAPAAAQGNPADAGDPAAGKRAIHQYACVACHRIPGVVGPAVEVGPPLSGMAQRRYIAGVLANTSENMMRWIQTPEAVNPLTAMPNLGVKETHARNIAAYLATLK